MTNRPYLDFGTGDTLHALGSMHEQGTASIYPAGLANPIRRGAFFQPGHAHHLAPAQHIAGVKACLERCKALGGKLGQHSRQWRGHKQQGLRRV